MTSKFTALIYKAIDEVNAESDGPQVEKSETTALLDPDGGVDSLLFINLIYSVERLLQAETGVNLVLITEETMALEPSPFRNVSTLADHLAARVAAAGR